MDPPKCPNPNPETSNYVTLYGKMNFANMIKLRVLKWEIILEHQGGPM